MDAIALRQKNVLAALEGRHLEALLVTSLFNIEYLTGFRGSAGVALVTRRGTVLWVDSRYIVQARAEAHSAVVHEARGGLLRAALRWIKAKGLKRLGYEESNVTCRAMDEIRKATGRGPRWVAAGGLVESLRMVKDAG